MTQEVLKLARDCIRDSVEYKQGKATAVEAVEDIDEALAQPQQEPPFSVQQAYAMAQVCLDLHEALGCKWGDNPYLAIAGLREAQPTTGDYALGYAEGFNDACKKPAQPQPPPVPPPWWPAVENILNEYGLQAIDFVADFKEALEQPHQEPVADDGWLQENTLLYRLTDERKPQNRDEINVSMADGSRSVESRTRRAGELLDRIRSTASPQRTWVGLTDEEITEVCTQSPFTAENYRAIEAKLKEKNT